MQKNQFGLGLVVALVALRVLIGMHFFREGVNKLRDPKPFSGGFFANAKGPFATPFYNLVWDRDGLARLNFQGTLSQWDQFQAQVEQHYGFDDAQRQRAKQIREGYEDQYKEYLAAKADDIREYRGNLKRRDEYARDQQRLEVASLRAQNDRIEEEIRGKKPGLVGPIDNMWRGLSRDLNAIATSEQRAAGTVMLPKPARRALDSDTIDAIIPWFDAVLGVLLVMGLLTGPAAIIGALFLFSVAISQWPVTPGAIATWPQVIEGVALLVVAAAGAGRYAGFDSVVDALRNRSGSRNSLSTEPRSASASRPSPEARRRQGTPS
ncbi:MAG: hypothetical protein AB7O38_07910 [Pirellulaceae bacterium]